jgi:DNA-binding transcriptional LysR family regulator
MDDFSLGPAERLARDLDWNLLHTFAVVVESGSVTRAAQKLGLQQPTVSSALKRLEERLGKRLIDRKPGRFELTEAGRLLYGEARDINGAILRLGTLIRDVREEVRGHVRIAIASHVVCPLLDETLGKFHARHPAATLSLEVSASRLAIEDVLARRVSFAICLVKDHSPNFSTAACFASFSGSSAVRPIPFSARGSAAVRPGRPGFRQLHHRPDDRCLAPGHADARPGATGRSGGGHLAQSRRGPPHDRGGAGDRPTADPCRAGGCGDGRLWRLPPYDNPPAIDVHVVWNPKARHNRAEAYLLKGLLDKIEATPIEARTYPSSANR